MKFLQVILFIAVVSSARCRNLPDKTDEFNEGEKVSKDLLRKTPKKFIPSVTTNEISKKEKGHQDSSKIFDEENLTPVKDEVAVESNSEVAAFLKPIFREDLPLETFRSSVTGATNRHRIELLRETEEKPAVDETVNKFLLAEDTLHLHSLSGELGASGLTKQEEAMIGGFRPFDWE